MNEEHDSSENLNEEEMIEAKLKGALKKLLPVAHLPVAKAKVLMKPVLI